jgi:membrane protease subunit HflK
MSWDDEGDKGASKGPWGSRGAGKESKPKKPWDQPPATPGGKEDIPDLDDMLRQAQDKFGNIFNKKPPTASNKKGVGFLLLLALGLWLATGFYRVSPGENTILLTFGKWTSTRSEPGLGYHIPWPVQTVIPVNVAFDRRVEVGFRDQSSSRVSGGAGEKNNVAEESQMLTGDENIVNIDFVVMWKIGDAKNYLFRIRDPETTVKKVSESAMREVIGQSPIQKVLTEGRADIETRTKILMQKMLDEYQSGIFINSVQLLSVDPPGPVVDAFDDVQRARADMERAKNEAETYQNDIVPRAKGDAKKIFQDAEAYKEAVVSQAKGDASRFKAVYAAYSEAKDVTEKRLYISTMEKIMKDSKKVLMNDARSGAVLPYLPLNQPPAGAAKTPAKGE